MEFNEKLQQLRKQKGVTQEQLAKALFVSRTAISKWESARGYPSIDSLKAISEFFGISIDELLSGDELLSIAEDETRQKGLGVRDLVFGLLDCSVAIFFFLPLFGLKTGGELRAVSLLNISEIAPYLKAVYYFIVIGAIAMGVLTLALQNCTGPLRAKIKSVLSLILNTLGTLVFIISLQPYAATFMFVLLVIKVLILIKQH